MKFHIALLSLVLSSGVAPVLAQDSPDTVRSRGYAAYASGDYAGALQYWRPLAEAGDPKAQSNLAAMYFEGLGVQQDDALAAHWWRMAAAQGYRRAWFSLGVMYGDGRGVSRNLPAAYALLSGLEPQDVQAPEYVSSLVSAMTPAQIQRGKRLANDMQASASDAEAMKRIDLEVETNAQRDAN